MGLSNIEKKSFGYSIIKNLVRFWHNIFFYRSFVVLGKENIPTDKPVIFTPNHQNALMDALALGFSTSKPVIFVARSDIFKKPTIARLLYFIKILPIYRIRDGFDTVKKNKEIIRKTIDVINEGNAMVILPEGNHSGLRRLRPLKKGFARMAFETEEANGFNLDIQIVPVGIDYDNYQKYRGSLIVNFGKPVAVADYIEQYKENSAIAINQIKNELSSQMKPLIIDIESVDNYDLYNELRIIYRSRMAQILNLDSKDEKNRLVIDQELILKLSRFEKDNPDATTEYQKLVLKYVNLRDSYKLTNKIVEQQGWSFIKLVYSAAALFLTLPIFIYGAVNNFLAYWLPLMLSKKIKDPQFQSSFKFAISLFSFPIFYIAQSILVLLITNSWEIAITYLISLPLGAALSWKWRHYFINNRVAWNYRVYETKHFSKLTDIQSIYNEILLQADNILNKD
jgi:1-acyl-sn-glycerol-3-phosphate acyltransferase